MILDTYIFIKVLILNIIFNNKFNIFFNNNNNNIYFIL